MKDLTRGPIAKQVVAIAVPIGAGMVFQTLYYLVDLYFVAGLGDTALAGVSLAVGLYPRILLDQIEPAVKALLAGGGQ